MIEGRSSAWFKRLLSRGYGARGSGFAPYIISTARWFTGSSSDSCASGLGGRILPGGLNREAISISAISTSSLSRASLNEVSRLLLIDRPILTDSGKFSSQPGDVGSLSF